MFEITREEIEWGGRPLVLETGRIARQADGAVLLVGGDGQVLDDERASGRRDDEAPLLILNVDMGLQQVLLVHKVDVETFVGVSLREAVQRFLHLVAPEVEVPREQLHRVWHRLAPRCGWGARRPLQGQAGHPCGHILLELEALLWFDAKDVALAFWILTRCAHW